MSAEATVNKRRRRRDDVVEQMSGPLREVYREIRKLWARANAGDVRNRYRIAVQVKRIRDKDGTKKYGTGVISRLAEALGRKERTLYEYAMVAESFGEEEIKEILKRKSLYGRPVSWSHLIALAHVVSPERREELLAETLEEGLSVRELTSRLEQQPEESDSETDPEADEDELEEPETGVPRTLRSALQHLRAQSQTVTQNAGLWDETLFARIEQADPDTFDEELRDTLAEALEERQEAGRVCRNEAKRLKKCLKKVETALEEQAVPA